MSVENQWDLLQRGQAQQGITLMKESFTDDPTPSTLVTLGLGYLWTGNYQAAEKHFQDWMHIYGVTADTYFALIGVAQWCLDNPVTASESWRLGLAAQYIDMAGGIKLPLLLWAASVLRPNNTLREEATQILKKKTMDVKVRYWPGPLAQLVLGQIDENILVERFSRKISPRQKWQIEFYKCVLKLERGTSSQRSFRLRMRTLVDTSAPEWSEGEHFVQLVRNEEFYIARHEAKT